MTNLSKPIEYFKKEAKKLFKKVEDNDLEALSRVRQVLKDQEDLTLMRIQHVIAVEYGFLKWENLIKGSVGELRMAITRKKNLTGTPLGIFYRGTGLIPPSLQNAALADMFDKMTLKEQERYLDEDARRMGLFDHR